MDLASEQKALNRIAAMLLALAALAERTAGRSAAVRSLVLWVLRPAAAAACAFAAEAGVPPLIVTGCTGPRSGDGPDAARLAATFRALAAAFHALSRQALRFAWSRASRRRDSAILLCGRLKAHRNVLAAHQPRYADTS